MHKARTENDLQRTQQQTDKPKILVPRFARKQSREQRVVVEGEGLSFLHSTHKKIDLKVALSFCCKRVEGSYVM